MKGEGRRECEGNVLSLHTIHIAFRPDIRSTNTFFDIWRISNWSEDFLRANDDDVEQVWWTEKQNKASIVLPPRSVVVHYLCSEHKWLFLGSRSQQNLYNLHGHNIRKLKREDDEVKSPSIS